MLEVRYLFMFKTIGTTIFTVSSQNGDDSTCLMYDTPQGVCKTLDHVFQHGNLNDVQTTVNVHAGNYTISSSRINALHQLTIIASGTVFFDRRNNAIHFDTTPSSRIFVLLFMR